MSRLLLPIDELNKFKENLRLVESKPEDIIDEILDILLLAYANGISDANDMLGADIKADTDVLADTLYKKYDGKDFRDRVREYCKDGTAEDIFKVADTEMHRDYNAAASYAAGQAGATEKTWCTMLDDKVRETHAYLEGVTLPVDDEFITDTGDHGLYPGGFEDAENNVNCRCYLEYQ